MSKSMSQKSKGNIDRNQLDDWSSEFFNNTQYTINKPTSRVVGFIKNENNSTINSYNPVKGLPFTIKFF